MTDYTPIECSEYSRYELAILHRRRLRLSWRDTEGTVHVAVLQPLDLETRAGEEFLIARDPGGHRLRLRLDYIRRMEPLER